MTRTHAIRRSAALACCIVLSSAGCAFQGLNSLALPGAVGRGHDASVYHVEVANVGTLEPNSPVMVDDVVVGSVAKMTVDDWHADVEVSLRPDVVVPANVVAKVGQTSLLGSMHVALDPPLGQAPQGRLQPGVDHPAHSIRGVPVDRADPLDVVDGGQLRRPRTDRRHHPQLQHRAERQGIRSP